MRDAGHYYLAATRTRTHAVYTTHEHLFLALLLPRIDHVLRYHVCAMKPLLREQIAISNRPIHCRLLILSFMKWNPGVLIHPWSFNIDIWEGKNVQWCEHWLHG